MMVSEICVTMKDADKTLKSEYLIYESYQVSEEDETIKNCIEATLKNFQGEPDKIIVRITLEMT